MTTIKSLTETQISKLRAEAQGEASEAGYNVYRVPAGADETETELVATAETRDEAMRLARRLGAHQVQRGLDGEVWGV